MTASIDVRCTINGQAVTAAVGPFETLAAFLRNRLGLTATRLGCQEGVCGSCTVLVDGKTLRSCLTLAVQMDGANIITVEGYAADDGLAAIQQAMIRHSGAQCGFCTSGMLAVIAEFLTDRTVADHGDDEVIRRRLSSVVCRCTGYQAIVNAVQDLARSTQGQA